MTDSSLFVTGYTTHIPQLWTGADARLNGRTLDDFSGGGYSKF